MPKPKLKGTKKQVMWVRVKPAVVERLRGIAAERDRSVSYVAAELLEKATAASEEGR